MTRPLRTDIGRLIGFGPRTVKKSSKAGGRSDRIAEYRPVYHHPRLAVAKLFRAQPVGRFACRSGDRFNRRLAPRLTILTGRNLPKIRQSKDPERSIINDKTTSAFTRVVAQTGILTPFTPEPAAHP